MSARVWSRFTVRKLDGTELKLRIQELPEDRLDDTLEFHMIYHCAEELIQRTIGLYTDKEANAEFREVFGMMMKKPTCVTTICVLDEDPGSVGDILGQATIVLETKEEFEREFSEMVKLLKSPKILKLIENLYIMGEMHDATATYGRNKPYYNDYGVSTRPEYRKLGIATQLLKVRRMICKDQAIEMTYAWMTSIGTQKAADRDEGGWETVFEVSSDELGRRLGLSFENPPPTIKLMVAAIKV